MTRLFSGLLRPFFILCDGCRRHLFKDLAERVFVAIRAVFSRGVDELLALGARVGLFRFGFCHGLSLPDLACREVRHV